MDELVTLEEDTYAERELPGGGTTRVLVGRKGQRVPASRLEDGGTLPGVPTPDRSTPDAEAVEQPARNASTEEWADYAVASDQATRDEVEGLSRAELIKAYGSDEESEDGG